MLHAKQVCHRKLILRMKNNRKLPLRAVPNLRRNVQKKLLRCSVQKKLSDDKAAQRDGHTRADGAVPEGGPGSIRRRQKREEDAGEEEGEEKERRSATWIKSNDPNTGGWGTTTKTTTTTPPPRPP